MRNTSARTRPAWCALLTSASLACADITPQDLHAAGCDAVWSVTTLDDASWLGESPRDLAARFADFTLLRTDDGSDESAPEMVRVQSSLRDGEAYRASEAPGCEPMRALGIPVSVTLTYAEGGQTRTATQDLTALVNAEDPELAHFADLAPGGSSRILMDQHGRSHDLSGFHGTTDWQMSASEEVYRPVDETTPWLQVWGGTYTRE